jgi:hypothetical protein
MVNPPRRRWIRSLAAAGAVGMATRPVQSAQPAQPLQPAHPGHPAHAAASRPAAAARPGMAIGASLAPDGALWVAGLNETGRLSVRRAPVPGQAWEAPLEPDIGSDRIAADGESRPKIAFGPGKQMVIAWTQPLARPFTGEIRLISSADGGQSFTPPITVHEDRQIITHRFEAVRFDAQGRLHVLWIDKRDAERARREGQAYRGAAVYRTVSLDGGRTFLGDQCLAHHSCECCRIALAEDRQGLVALWRHVFEPNHRDHAFARIPAGADCIQPVRATWDQWALDACPHHGPALVPDQQGGFHLVWFGHRDSRPAVRLGRLSAQGQPQERVIEIPDDSAEHADLASNGRHLVLAWRGLAGSVQVIRAWVSADDGRHFELRELARAEGRTDHPRLLSSSQGIWLVWNTAAGLQVQRIV